MSLSEFHAHHGGQSAQQDNWEQKRGATIKRLNNSSALGGRKVQPRRRTVQHYLLQQNDDKWGPQTLHAPIHTVEDRLCYACKHEWGFSAPNNINTSYI